MDYKSLKEEMLLYKDTMTNMERFKAYALGEEVDRIPFMIGGADTLSSLYGYTIGEYRRSFEVQCAMMENMKRDFGANPVASVSLSLKGVGEALGSKVKYPENGLDFVDDFVLKDYDMLSKLEFNPKTNVFLIKKLNQIRQYKETFGADFPVASGIAGPLTTAVAIRKTEHVMKDMIKNKDNLHELLDFSVKCSLKWLETVSEEFGAVNTGLADPASSMSLISEKQYREFSKPHMENLLDGIKSITGRKPTVHICGKTKAIWNDLVDLGIPGFSLDNCEDLEELKNTVGEKMSISGNVPPVEVMRNGSIDDVIESVKKCLIKGSNSPMGYTLAIGCQIPIGTPRENIEAYMYAARRYGRGAKKGEYCKGLIEEGLI